MNTPTPETDHLERNLGNAAHPVLSSFCRKLERERDEARETIAATLRAGQTAQEIIIAVTKERDEARGQRDRLAEALQNVIDEDGTPMSIDRADEALQSLTTNQP